MCPGSLTDALSEQKVSLCAEHYSSAHKLPFFHNSIKFHSLTSPVASMNKGDYTYILVQLYKSWHQSLLHWIWHHTNYQWVFLKHNNPCTDGLWCVVVPSHLCDTMTRVKNQGRKTNQSPAWESGSQNKAITLVSESGVAPRERTETKAVLKETHHEATINQVPHFTNVILIKAKYLWK